MKDIIIVGAGGFGREVAWLIERINHKSPQWNLLGFVDDEKTYRNQLLMGKYQIIEDVDWLLESKQKLNVVCAIGNAKVRQKVSSRLMANKNIQFPILIDPSVIMSEDVKIGAGSILCAGTIITVNVEIGSHCLINLDCTIGHDVILHDYITAYPSVNISGHVEIGNCCELGTGAQIIQGKKICADSIVGAGSVVINDIVERGTYVGVPAKII